MSIANQISKYAAEIADSQEARALHLEKEQQDLKARMAQLKSESQAARLAFKRLPNFQAEIGSDYQCPRCWIENETRSALRAIGSDTDNDILRCRTCDSKFVIQS